MNAMVMRTGDLRMCQLLLCLVLCLCLVGMGQEIFYHQGFFRSFLIIQWKLTPSWAHYFESSLFVVVCMMLLIGVLSRQLWAFLSIFVFLLIVFLMQSYVHNTRSIGTMVLIYLPAIFAPLALGLILNRQFATRIPFLSIENMLFVALSASYFAYAKECFVGNPTLVTVVTEATEHIFALSVSKHWVVGLLKLIAFHNIFLGVGVFTLRGMKLIQYITIYGLVLSSQYYFAAPEKGMGEALIHASQWGVPLSLYYMGKIRTVI